MAHCRRDVCFDTKDASGCRCDCAGCVTVRHPPPPPPGSAPTPATSLVPEHCRGDVCWASKDASGACQCGCDECERVVRTRKSAVGDRAIPQAAARSAPREPSPPRSRALPAFFLVFTISGAGFWAFSKQIIGFIENRPTGASFTEDDREPKKTSKLAALAMEAEIKCVGMPDDSFSCSIHNTGAVDGAICWDLFIDGSKGTAKAHGCSGNVSAGSTQTKAVRDFTPSITSIGRIDGVRVENAAPK